MFQIKQLDHVVLRARNQGEMVKFYKEALGCVEARTSAEYGITMMRAGQSLIDIVDATGKIGRMKGAPPGEEGHNMEHLCLRIEPFDEAMIREHFARFGVTPSPVEDRFGADGTGPSMYLEDPEGNTIELKGSPHS